MEIFPILTLFMLKASQSMLSESVSKMSLSSCVFRVFLLNLHPRREEAPRRLKGYVRRS